MSITRSSAFPSSSASLQQHWCTRLLWLSTECCVRMSGTVLSSVSKGQSSSRSTLTFGGNLGLYEEVEECGFEKCLRIYLSRHSSLLLDPFADSKLFEEESLKLFSIDYYLGVSQWINMDAFRMTKAVVVVVNCNNLSCSLEHTLECVNNVFTMSFSEAFCKCIIFNPSHNDIAFPNASEFMVVFPDEPYEQVGEKLLKECAQKVKAKLYGKISVLDSPEGSTTLLLRTPVDKLTLQEFSKTSLRSRCAKIKGDLLLQLGKPSEALESYSTTYFSSTVDPLWRSATLECIAAALYYKAYVLFQSINKGEITLLSLQRESRPINIDLLNKLASLRNCLDIFLAEQKKDIKMLKNSVTLPPLYYHVRYDLRKSMIQSFSEFTNALTELRQSEEPESLIINLVRRMKASLHQFSLDVKQVINAFLKESVAQQELASQMFSISLTDRKIEARLMQLSFCVSTGQKEEFLNQLRTTMQLSGTCTGEKVYRRIMMYCVELSLRLGYLRVAVAQLTRLVSWEWEKENYSAALSAAIFCCTVAGISIGVTETSVTAQNSFLENGCLSSLVPNAEVIKGNLRAPLSMFQAQILQQLVSALEKANVRLGMLCRVSLFTLLHCSSFLSEEVQQKLIHHVQVDASNVPFLSLEEKNSPFLKHTKAIELPSDMAPTTVPICGPIFTYIDTERLQLTILSLNGKKLDSNVVWAVGDVGRVKVKFVNPLQHRIHFCSICLSCSSIQSSAYSISSPTEHPSSYVVQDVFLDPLQEKDVFLSVIPASEGSITIDSVECQLSFMGSTLLRMSFVEPLIVPVMQRLPFISCTPSIYESVLFESQRQQFSLILSNCGLIPVDTITVSAHNQECQLENCNGCVESPSSKTFFVVIDRTSISASTPLEVSSSVAVNGYIEAPSVIDSSVVQLVCFRVNYGAHYPPLSPPLGIPGAIPVFGVVPQRTFETRLPIYLESGLRVKDLIPTANTNFYRLSLHNLNSKRSFSVSSRLNLDDEACEESQPILPCSAYVIPKIELFSFTNNDTHKCNRISWFEKETGSSGNLLIDVFALKQFEKSYFKYQVHASVSISVEGTRHHINLTSEGINQTAPNHHQPSAIICKPISSVSIEVSVFFDKQITSKKVRLKACVCPTEEAKSLSGPIVSWLFPRGGDAFFREFELVPIFTGPLSIQISLLREDGQNVSYDVPFYVQD